MFQIVCPLCGKSSVADLYDPSEFDYDVYGKFVKSLGRGGGFEHSDRTSILGDEDSREILEAMARRALIIVKMLYDQKYLTNEDLQEIFCEPDE